MTNISVDSTEMSGDQVFIVNSARSAVSVARTVARS
jgi:hypothetical protein